jgi:hypothetical protein
MPRRQPLTIAILGSNTLAEHVLVLLLEDEGYIMRLLKAPHMGPPTVLPEGGSVDELLEGVDVVLLWPAPTLRDEAREAFVGATRSTPQTAAIPVLTLSRGCLAGRAGRRCAPVKRQFEQLAQIIKAVLGSPAGSVGFLDLAGLAGPGDPS